jgi:hypothetical protein
VAIGFCAIFLAPFTTFWTLAAFTTLRIFEARAAGFFAAGFLAAAEGFALVDFGFFVLVFATLILP